MNNDRVIVIDKTKAITVHVDKINFNDLMQMDQMFWARTDSISKMREGKNDDDPNS